MAVPAYGTPATNPNFARGEVVVYSLHGTTNANTAPWAQEFGTSQHTGSVDPRRVVNP
jgi:hypothetical protein